MKKIRTFEGVQKNLPLTKWIRTMKLTCLLITLALVQVSAETYSQTKKLTLNLKDAPLAVLFEEIEKTSEFNFFYDSSGLDLSQKVTVTVEDSNIETVLDMLFSDSDISYEIFNRYIILKSKERESVRERLFAQQRAVSGMITDSNGQPLPGVTVVVKGTTQGTVTGANGNYTLTNIPEDATLVFSFVGMRTQEVVVANQTRIDVRMEEETIGLEEVVAIGYGTKLSRNITTSISTVRSDELAQTSIANASEAMIGKISGVQIQQTSGEPGAVPVIRIRGIGSLRSDSWPLFVIDGFPTDDRDVFASIPVEEIERIDILKDAASAAIYGSRAGNGVVLVTTKSGSKSRKPTFSVKVNYGFENAEKRYDVLGPEEFADMAIDALNMKGQEIPEILTNKSLWKPTDWQDAILRTGNFQNYRINASGSGEKVDYLFSAGLINHDGIAINSWHKEYNFRMKLDAQLNDMLKVGTSVIPSYSESRIQALQGKNNSSGEGAMAEAVSMPPILPVYNDIGDYYINRQEGNMFNNQIGNPVARMLETEDDRNYYTQTTQFYLQLTPIKGLTLKTELSNSFKSYQREFYRSGAASGNGVGTGMGNLSKPDLSAIDASRDLTKTVNWYWSNTATYDYIFRDAITLSALAGYDLSNVKYSSTSIIPRTDESTPVAFDNTVIRNVQGAKLRTGNSSNTEYRFDGIFGRISLDYESKYLISTSVRHDRSSRFGPNAKGGIFYSISGGWNISEEDFWSINFINLLKLRASYGETGNDRIGNDYAWLSNLTTGWTAWGDPDGGEYRSATVRPGGFSNYDLSWEKNKQYDLGIDFAILNNRINFSFDWYKRNSNTIFSTSIPAINGKASSLAQNLGNLENKGVEFSVTSPILIGDFKWESNFNISFNKNKIVSLTENQDKLPDASTMVHNALRYYVGQPIGDFYLYKVIGTFNNAQELADGAKLGNQIVGDLRFEDISGPDGVPDGKIDANDITKQGNFQPDFIFGFNNSFKYKNLYMNIAMNGQVGGEIFFIFARAPSVCRELENNLAGAADRWRSESDPGNGSFPVAGSPNIGTNVNANTRFLHSSDFLRINNITFGYDLPKTMAWTKDLDVSLYFSIKNAFTISNYPGLNPEANYFGSNSIQNGVDGGQYPLARNFTFGINLNF
jgi:TonB-linked SusC/RagA family outer membrane protein